MTVVVKLSEAEIRAAIAEWLDNNSEHVQNASDSGVVTLQRDPIFGEYTATVEFVEVQS